VQEPVFESQTKTKLGSTDMGPKGPSLKEFVGKFMQQSLDTWLHKNRETAEAIKRKIEENEHERKELAGIRNIARERAKSSATAASTSVTATPAPRSPPCSSSRATPPPAPSPPPATSRPRPSSPSRASRSTPSA
jgi:DNA gyrase/topoisomerase IV subunit B